MQKEEEIKPCPLCGKEVLLFTDPSKDGTIVWGRLHHGPHTDCGISFIDDLPIVVAKWNKRVSDLKTIS